MRLLQPLCWALLVALALRFLLRSVPGPRRRGAPDVLVKDPVCQAYVLRSRALTRTEDGVLHHFCSPECARQFAHGGSRSRG
jgi:YHS domain-containing protein